MTLSVVVVLLVFPLSFIAWVCSVVCVRVVISDSICVYDDCRDDIRAAVVSAVVYYVGVVAVVGMCVAVDHDDVVAVVGAVVVILLL